MLYLVFLFFTFQCAQGCPDNFTGVFVTATFYLRENEVIKLVGQIDVTGTTESVETGSRLVDEPEPDLNQIELGPVGRRGAANSVQRNSLEEIEERAHARLMRAIEAGNPFQVKAAQEFYLRASETLRRLDLAVETERRTALEQIPLRQIENVALQISIWMRSALEQFLSSESPGLMAITDQGEFKFLAIEQFRGILHATVKVSIRTNPPIPEWAAAKVIEAWNIH